MPHCSTCNSCISVRIPVAEFQPSRSQKRTLKKNTDLEISPVAAEFNATHFNLYQTYLAARHRGGGMDQPTPEDYMAYLTSSWAETVFFEMRLQGQVIAVAVVDKMDNAMSAVYTFFDPSFSHRSPGRFAVLYEIEQAKEAGLTWLYLGYWINACQKMKYKNEYQPLEYYIDNNWRRDVHAPAPAPALDITHTPPA